MAENARLIPVKSVVTLPAVLTKREHFAGLAMQGMLSSNDVWNAAAIKDPKNADAFMARGAVEMADALIEALNENDDTE